MTNKIRLLIFTSLLLSLSSAIFGQTGSIRGIVSDKDIEERIPFATIAIYADNDREGEPVAGDVSDSDGNFSIGRLPVGTYMLVVSFIGYENTEVPEIIISAGSAPVNAGTIYLSQSLTDMEEVEITAMARTSASRIDRTTYQASDFETARGGSASDILNRLPSVAVGPDGEVSVRGTSDFIVYLNGRPTNLEPSMLLAQVSANSIESIEIITVPGARYDAHGAGGIININTRRSGLEGLSASANILGGSAPWGETTHRYSGYKMNNDLFGGSLDLLYNNDLISVYSNLYYNNRNLNGVRNGNARILQANDEYYTLSGTGARPESHENYSVNAGIVAELSERSSLDVSYFFANRNERRSALYLYEGQGLSGSQGSTDFWTYNPNTGDRLGIIHNATVDYKLAMNNSTELNMMASYERSELRRDLSNPNYNYNEAADLISGIEGHIMQSDNTPLDGFRFYADFIKEFDNGNSIGAGLQPQILSNRGSFTYDTLNTVQNTWGSFSSLENDFDLDRGIYAAYINYTGRSGRLSYMGGLRMEYTDQTINLRNPDFFSVFDRETKSEYSLNRGDWFPSFHASLQVFENDEINVAASRRINRPQTQNMAPFLYRRHHEVYEVGDPALEPEYLTNLELSYLARVGVHNVHLTGFYRGTDNAVFRVYTLFPEENILIRSFTNAGKATAFGAELNTNILFGSLARLFIGGSLYNFNVQGDIFGYNEDNTSTNWSLKGNMNFFLTRALRLTADFDWRSGTVTAQGAEDSFIITSAALNYSPELLRGWNMSLRVLDILGTNITNWSTRAYNNTGRQIFFQETDYTRYGPVMELGITYSFNINGRNLRRDVQTFGEEEY